MQHAILLLAPFRITSSLYFINNIIFAIKYSLLRLFRHTLILMVPIRCVRLSSGDGLRKPLGLLGDSEESDRDPVMICIADRQVDQPAEP